MGSTSKFCQANRSRLPQAMRSALWEGCLIAPFPEPVAETFRCIGLAIGTQNECLTLHGTRCSFYDLHQLRQDG
ncbi:hypothetical protein AD947_08835 [Acetobacter tropicalis]|uniref:Uncharacterized protein n=1 Tax=Acetobacter tropicalis TaxID=104102 RepID=A0A149TW16_9PROT|nr:hypothetical protein AD947_08835 [Acetobacter tropicalis]